MDRFEKKRAARGVAPKGPDVMAAIVAENKELKTQITEMSLTIQVQADAIAKLEEQATKPKPKAKAKKGTKADDPSLMESMIEDANKPKEATKKKPAKKAAE